MSDQRPSLRQRLRKAALLGAGLSLLLGFWGIHHVDGFLSSPLSPEGGSRKVVIPRGARFDDILALLERRGVLKERGLFALYVRSKGYASELKAGTYEIDLRATPRELLTQLIGGAAFDAIRVTLPEGLNRWQVADLLAGQGLVDRSAFLAKIAADDLEGRLFPDTYDLGKGWPLARILDTLTERFDEIYAEVIAGHPNAAELDSPLVRRHLLTLASLIEKEAQHPEERRLISRVFHNRLAQKMRLQTDPTCVYGPDTYRQVPTPSLCKDPESRYSTYIIDGLPPGPIANPGRASLEAALYPATGDKAAKLLYFVARRDGSRRHHFSETHAEHREAVSRYLKRSEAR